jgi:hypothetical protein
MYRVWGDGKQMVKDDIFDYFGLVGHTNEELKKMGYIVWMPVQTQGSWLGEGDTGTFMNMLGNGLRAYEHGSFGGWGGRQVDAPVFSFQPANPAALDSTLQGMMATMSAISSDSAARKDEVTLPDFFGVAERDFAARMKWSVTPSYDDGNHEPNVDISSGLNIEATPGQKIQLTGNVTDPDKDELTIQWWQFKVGSYPGDVVIENSSSSNAVITVPPDAKPGQTIHAIIEVTDNGTPALTSYARVIIQVAAAQ